MKTRIIIHWLRRDLRWHDNMALQQAHQKNIPVLPIFIFDQNILSKLENRQDGRVQFIHENLERMHQSLQSKGGGIRFFYSHPEDAWNQLIEEFEIAEVFFNRDYEPYARERDRKIYDFLLSKNIPLTTCKDHVIFEKSEITKDDGKPYTVFTPYSKKWKAALNNQNFEIQSSENLNHWHQWQSQPIPTLGEMGFEKTTLQFPPAQFNSQIISHYHETRDIPSINGTSKLSLHLRFGTISIRECVNIALKSNETWLNELIWRDFYQMIIYHFPHSATQSFKPQYDRVQWINNEVEFNQWCKGQTGYPIVDAGMRELNETGHMHNRVRMIVASFLTKHLMIDWRWGERYFAEKLLDFDLASNVGGWQWAAGSGCDAAPYFRIFNPYSQTEKFDAQELYIKKWVPEYKSTSYPAPIVDHKFARERCLRIYKEALQ
jgi:deoxyribodipyrimidine photo-lyase